jgi:hypothetical protein
LRKVNSHSVPEGDYAEEDQIGGDCGTHGGEDIEIQGLGMENLKV